MDAAAERIPVAGICGRNSVRLLTLLALAAAALAVAAPAAMAASGNGNQGSPDLNPLWKSYPLNPGAGKVHEGTSTRPRETRSRPSVSAKDAGSGGGSMVAFAATAGGLVALTVLAGAVLSLRRARTPQQETKGARMAGFRKKRSGADPAPRAAERVASYLAGGNEAAAEPHAAVSASDGATEGAEPVAPEPVAAGDPSTVAAHVQGVLKAAEDAATKMLDEARAKAAEVRQEAERERAAHLESAEVEAAGLRAQAERERQAAAAAHQEAQSEADAIRAAAERDAASFGTDAKARYEELLEHTALAKERLRRLVGGLHLIADQLDSLIGPEEEAAVADEEHNGAGEQSLVDALEPETTADAATR